MAKANLLLPTLAAALLAACAGADAPAAAEDGPSLVGHYRIEAIEQAGELLLTPDRRFQYAFTTGALDEHAAGRWEFVDGATCLTTEPKPVPPSFAKAGAVTDPAAPTLLVTLPNGRGIPGVDFVIGFDSGEPVTGYTQEYGWTLPEDEARVPRWVQLNEPIFNIASPRFALDAADHGKLRVVLTPNDLGTVDFEQACLEATAVGVVLHRKEGDMPFKRVADGA
jgi:hypothetical protein